MCCCWNALFDSAVTSGEGATGLVLSYSYLLDRLGAIKFTFLRESAAEFCLLPNVSWKESKSLTDGRSPPDFCYSGSGFLLWKLLISSVSVKELGSNPILTRWGSCMKSSWLPPMSSHLYWLFFCEAAANISSIFILLLLLLLLLFFSSSFFSSL